MRKYYYSPSQFGRRSPMDDPNFVQRVINGRQVTENNIDRVDAWMALGPEVHADLDRVLTSLGSLVDAIPDKPPKAKRDADGQVQWTRDVDATIIRLYSTSSWKAIGDAIGVPVPAVLTRAKELGLDVT